MFKGSCLCQEVTFEINAIEPTIAHCHCTMCRKFHGAAFSTLAEVKLSELFWTSGEQLITKYTADNKTQRWFCQKCGASLAFLSHYNLADKTIEISLATLDTLPSQLKVNAHIYLESKVPWLTINDNLPQYLAFRTAK